MYTEQDIKAGLDGTFTRVVITEYETRIVTETGLPLDHIPDHKKPLPPNHGQRGPGATKRCHWTPEKVAELVRLRGMGWTKKRCARHFEASEDSVRAQLKRIRVGEVTS